MFIANNFPLFAVKQGDCKTARPLLKEKFHFLYNKRSILTSKIEIRKKVVKIGSQLIKIKLCYCFMMKCTCVVGVGGKYLSIKQCCQKSSDIRIF